MTSRATWWSGRWRSTRERGSCTSRPRPGSRPATGATSWWGRRPTSWTRPTAAATGTAPRPRTDPDALASSLGPALAWIEGAVGPVRVTGELVGGWTSTMVGLETAEGGGCRRQPTETAPLQMSQHPRTRGTAPHRRAARGPGHRRRSGTRPYHPAMSVAGLRAAVAASRRRRPRTDERDRLDASVAPLLGVATPAPSSS